MEINQINVVFYKLQSAVAKIRALQMFSSTEAEVKRDFLAALSYYCFCLLFLSRTQIFFPLLLPLLRFRVCGYCCNVLYENISCTRYCTDFCNFSFLTFLYLEITASSFSPSEIL